MSGKKPILALPQGIPRIQASATTSLPSGSPNLVSQKKADTGYYYELFGEKYVSQHEPMAYEAPSPSPSSSTSEYITIDPAHLKSKEEDPDAAPGSSIVFPGPSNHNLHPYQLRVNLPNLTHDHQGGYKHDRTCTKSVHKVVFLFCSITLAIIIACVIFVEMKKMQEAADTYLNN